MSEICNKEKQRSPLQCQNLQCFKRMKKVGEKDVYSKVKGQDHFCALKFSTKIRGSPFYSEYNELPDPSHPNPTTVCWFPASPLLPALDWYLTCSHFIVTSLPEVRARQGRGRCDIPSLIQEDAHPQLPMTETRTCPGGVCEEDEPR